MDPSLQAGELLSQENGVWGPFAPCVFQFRHRPHSHPVREPQHGWSAKM